MLPTIIVYGNCQAQAVAITLENCQPKPPAFRVLYVASFDNPSDGTATLAAGDVASCDLLLEQLDREPFPYRDRLPAHCHTVRFPSVDINVLWPSTDTNPYNIPEPPRFPFGRFAYGDRMIVRYIDQGLSEDAVLHEYLTHWEENAPNLDRFMEIDSARLVARDAACDVPMASFITENLGTSRLFWTPNHPTKALLFELITRLLERARVDSGFLDNLDFEHAFRTHFHGEPLGQVGVPIHPFVAKHFALQWYRTDQEYPYYDETISWTTYLQEMIRNGIAQKQAGSARAIS